MNTLCLKRKTGSRLYIDHNGERLEIVVLKTLENGLVLSFQGPLSFSITRDEAKKKEPRRLAS